MSELFKVYFLSSNVRTCFFYFNDSDLRHFERHGCSVKIRYGLNRENLTYGCVNLTPASEVPPKSIGVTSLYAEKLGFKENELVLLSNCNVDSINSLQILPEKEEDYVILLSCKSLLETYLLNQVSVVAEGQVFPLYVFSNISINVEIGKLSLQSGFGRLEKFTELTVLHPSEKPRNSNIENEVKLDIENQNRKGNMSSLVLHQLTEILESRFSVKRTSDQKNVDSFFKHVLEENSNRALEYKILPSFLFLDSTLKPIQNKFIIVSNLQYAGSTYGPYCLKVLCQVEKVVNSTLEKGSSDDEKKDEDSSLNVYVISLNNNDSNTAICPSELMKKLMLFVGSRIKIKEMKKSATKTKLWEWSGKIKYKKETSNCFWGRLAFLRENVRGTVVNNFKFDYKTNTLILGGPGAGKTFILKDISNELENDFVFCVIINCKSLRGKKIESLYKLWVDSLRACASQEPSLLILDDLHSLTYIDEEEGQFNRLYSERVVDLVSDLIQTFQKNFNVNVIATATNLSHLSSIVSKHGPRLFQNVLTIPELDFTERKCAIKFVLNNKASSETIKSLDLEKISSSTNGYTMQDINDLVDKAIFNSLLRNEDENLSSISQLDFDSAISETTPLSLRNVKLKQNIDTKWEDVGGMMEPKKTLIEVFSWPLKYPNIIESCPLRLQRGVLLYGAPGTGKTLLAGALANKCGLNFISVKGPEVLSKYVGASEEGVRNLFLQAEKTQPCLLFFDEFDSLAPKRGHDNTGVTDRVVNQLLTQLDGVESLNGVWVLAATSRPDLLDSALLRPGRLDKMVFCDVPNEIDRLSILEVLSQNLSKAEDVNLSVIAENSEGYTGADLQAVLYSAQMSAIKEEKISLGKKFVIKVKQNHLFKALSEVTPSLSRREKTRYKKIYDRFLYSRKQNFVESYDSIQRVTLA